MAARVDLAQEAGQDAADLARLALDVCRQHQAVQSVPRPRPRPPRQASRLLPTTTVCAPETGRPASAYRAARPQARPTARA